MNRRMAQVGPHERGIPFRQWLMREIKRMGEAHAARFTQQDRENAPLKRKRIWTPRDSYGWRSL